MNIPAPNYPRTAHAIPPFLCACRTRLLSRCPFRRQWQSALRPILTERSTCPSQVRRLEIAHKVGRPHLRTVRCPQASYSTHGAEHVDPIVIDRRRGARPIRIIEPSIIGFPIACPDEPYPCPRLSRRLAPKRGYRLSARGRAGKRVHELWQGRNSRGPPVHATAPSAHLSESVG